MEEKEKAQPADSSRKQADSHHSGTNGEDKQAVTVGQKIYDLVMESLRNCK